MLITLSFTDIGKFRDRLCLGVYGGKLDRFPSFIKLSFCYVYNNRYHVFNFKRNQLMRLRMLKKDFSTQTAVVFQLPYFNNLIIEKILSQWIRQHGCFVTTRFEFM